MSNDTFQVAKGGRSSGKSTTIAIKIILLMVKYKVNALVVRRVAGTLRKSCYEQIKEAIIMIGLESCFKFRDTIMEIVYRPTGQVIMFRGADDAGKIKSIKTSKYPIGILWIEELAEFKEPDAVDTIVDSVVRAEIGFNYQVFFSYNPPKRRSNWVNKKYDSKVVKLSDTFIHHSTSFDNPYLSEAFIKRARSFEGTDFYKWNYLGEPLGGGLVPFNNLYFEVIETKKILSFDYLLQGLDWGFGVDPLAFTRNYLDRARRDLYVFDEYYGQKVHNITLYKWLEARKYNRARIVADSADPFRVANLKSYGVHVVGAKKGPGSIESGLEWLDSLNRIIIDPYRCPNTAKEFEDSDYARDRDGNLLPLLDPKLPDHAIDSIRYATERDQVSTRDLDKQYS